MFYSLYNLFILYRIMVSIHGVYITYSFFTWLLGTSYIYSIWLLSFIYNPYPVKQLEDKPKKENLP